MCLQRPLLGTSDRLRLTESHLVQIRVWARKEAIESGQGDYALEKTGPILAFFEEYYNSSYPLSKSGAGTCATEAVRGSRRLTLGDLCAVLSDQIAIPDFSAGAMENWGLVMYSEPALLYNPAVSSTKDKEWVASVISHELAHMVKSRRAAATTMAAGTKRNKNCSSKKHSTLNTKRLLLKALCFFSIHFRLM